MSGLKGSDKYLLPCIPNTALLMQRHHKSSMRSAVG